MSNCIQFLEAYMAHSHYFVFSTFNDESHNVLGHMVHMYIVTEKYIWAFRKQCSYTHADGP